MFATQKMYQTVDRTQYEAIKKRHVNATFEDYDQGLDSDKWTALMREFALLMPDRAVMIDRFRAQRLQNGFNVRIPLADCISYFEQFYFLYTTTDPLFELNDAEKRALTDLMWDIEHCEPGIQERFELALALYRRDTNWISGHLSQARYHVLEGLAERCNRALSIGNSYSPHTIKFMKGLAQEKQLGMDPEAALTDIYSIERAKIARYFTAHYLAAFHAYEASAADDLSQQLLNEFTDFLSGKVDTAQWEQEGVMIPDSLVGEFHRFFEMKSFDAVMEYLRDDSDEDHLKLKQKADFLVGIRSLVKKQLLQNGYYVSMADLHARPAQCQSAFPIWWVDHISMGHVIEQMLVLGTGPVSALKLASVAQHLTPAELLMIVQFRREDNLSPLPYCDHLEAFHQGLVHDGVDWAPGGYRAARQEARALLERNTDLHQASAVGYLARTDDWYTALVLHQNDRASLFKLLRHLMWAVVQSLGSALKCLGLFLMCIFVPLMPAALFGALLGTFSGWLILAEIALFSTAFASSSLLFLFNVLFTFAALVLFNVLIVMFIFPHQEHLFNRLFDALASEWNQLSHSIRAAATNMGALVAGVFTALFSDVEPAAMMDTLSDRCERSIERLLFTPEDASANQKGALLARLWDQVQADGPWDSEAALNERLNKKYEVTYQGQTRQLSFSQVASTRRLHSERFNLDEPPSVYGFFAKVRATTTDSMLEERPVMGLAA